MRPMLPATPAAEAIRRTPAQRLAVLHRLFVVAVLGFASGLPLALTGQAMQAWLSVEGLDVATIGFLSLVGLPYTFKFLWAPLMDRFDLPWLGRRRGWLVATQLALAARAVRARRHLAQRRDAGLCAAGGGGGLHFGLAGRGHRRLPHRPAAGARTRPGRLAGGGRVPPGDDLVGRHCADLDRCPAGQRLELARCLPPDGRSDGGRSRRLGHPAAQAGVAAADRQGRHADPQRPDRLRRRGGRGRRGLRLHRPRGGAGRARADGAAVAGQRTERVLAGALGRPGLAADRHRHHAAAGGLGRAARQIRVAARLGCRTTSARPARSPSCC